jgi:hypothetical protein
VKQQAHDGKQQQQPQGLEDAQAHVTYHVPPGLDLAGEAGSQLGVRAAAQGLLAMPYLSEILPVGGAGDRLGLRCEVTGEGLPAAMLPYCGRSMMEGLIRDLQAKEYLYWQLTGTQVGCTAAAVAYFWRSDCGGLFPRGLAATLCVLRECDAMMGVVRSACVALSSTPLLKWKCCCPSYGAHGLQLLLPCQHDSTKAPVKPQQPGSTVIAAWLAAAAVSCRSPPP